MVSTSTTTSSIVVVVILLVSRYYLSQRSSCVCIGIQSVILRLHHTSVEYPLPGSLVVRLHLQFPYQEKAMGICQFSGSP